MKYLLDTSVLIELLRQKIWIKMFMENHKKDDFLTSAICEAEIYEGIYREKEENISKKKSTFNQIVTSLFETIIPFDSHQAELAGRMRAELTGKGMLIGDLDILIAAASIHSHATLLTSNPKHFRRIPHLAIESVLS